MFSDAFYRTISTVAQFVLDTCALDRIECALYLAARQHITAGAGVLVNKTRICHNIYVSVHTKAQLKKKSTARNKYIQKGS